MPNTTHRPLAKRFPNITEISKVSRMDLPCIQLGELLGLGRCPEQVWFSQALSPKSFGQSHLKGFYTTKTKCSLSCLFPKSIKEKKGILENESHRRELEGSSGPISCGKRTWDEDVQHLEQPQPETLQGLHHIPREAVPGNGGSRE